MGLFWHFHLHCPCLFSSQAASVPPTCCFRILLKHTLLEEFYCFTNSRALKHCQWRVCSCYVTLLHQTVVGINSFSQSIYTVQHIYYLLESLEQLGRLAIVRVRTQLFTLSLRSVLCDYVILDEYSCTNILKVYLWKENIL